MILSLTKYMQVIYYVSIDIFRVMLSLKKYMYILLYIYKTYKKHVLHICLYVYKHSGVCITAT